MALNDWKATSVKLGGIGRSMIFDLWAAGDLGSVKIGSRRFSTDAQIDAYESHLEEITATDGGRQVVVQERLTELGAR
jgi:hypothetical protein